MRFGLVDRYVFREMIGPFFVGLVVYSFLFIVNLLFQLAEISIQQGLSPGISVLLFLLSLPSLLAYTLPIALLVGTIIAFSRLSADSEIVALRASGVPLAMLLRAPLAFAGILTVVLLSLNFWLIPHSRMEATRIQDRAGKALNLVRLLRPGVFFDRVPGLLLYADGVDLENDTYRDVLIYQRPGRGEDVLTLADWARVIQSRESGVLQFVTGDCQTLHFNRKKPGKVDVSTFSKQTVTLHLGNAEAGSAGSKALMEIRTRELMARMRMARAGEAGNGETESLPALRYEFHRRFSGGVAAIFFALIGVPLGIVNLRGGRGAGFTLSLLLVLGYWVLLTGLSDLGSNGTVTPSVAAWLPNGCLLCLAWPLIRYRDRVVQWRILDLALSLLPGRWKEDGCDDAASCRSGSPPGGRISILDRYVLKRLLVYLALIASSILVLHWVIETRGLSEYLKGPEQWRLLGGYLINQAPAVLSILLPLAVLLTALVTFGILEKGNEITAFKASGISLYRISLPALGLAVLASLLLWVMGETVVPSTSRKAREYKDRLRNFASRNLPSNSDVWVFAPDRKTLYHYNFRFPNEQRYRGFSQYSLRQDRFRIAGRFFAKHAAFTKEREIQFEKAWEWRAGPSEEASFASMPKGSRTLPLSIDYFSVPSFLEGRYFSSKDLRRLIGELDAKGYPSFSQRMDYHRKGADAAAPVALLLAGLPFAFATGRKGSLYGVAVALALCVVYYVFAAVFGAAGEMRWLEPGLAAWAPSILVGLTGGYLLVNLRT